MPIDHLPREDGPSLETYLETRLNLITVAIAEQLAAADRLYHQRFEAQAATVHAAFEAHQHAISLALAAAKDAVAAALAASDRAVQKAEIAAEKRFEGVNEFRAALADQQRTLMPRAEVDILMRALGERMEVVTTANGQRITVLEQLLGNRQAEMVGIKGGFGNAAGIIGFVLAVLGILAYVASRF